MAQRAPERIRSAWLPGQSDWHASWYSLGAWECCRALLCGELVAMLSDRTHRVCTPTQICYTVAADPQGNTASRPHVGRLVRERRVWQPLP